METGNAAPRHASSVGETPHYLDGVYRIAADPSTSAGEPDRAPAADSRNRPSADENGTAMQDNWYARWQAACGYAGFAPAMIYPDDLVFYGSQTYGRAAEAGFEAGKDAGRRETLFKGALDMYNERMGNAPAPSAEAPGNSGAAVYPYAVPPSWDAYHSGSRAGRYEAQLWLARDRNLLRTARLYVQKGQQLFRAGRYAEAADAFRLAATSDNGDASSRLLAAHAYFALGQYDKAVTYLRRAFELQPKIAFLDFSIHAEYGSADDFEKHVQALQKACEDRPNDATALTLLGYVYRHSDNREASDRVLARAYKLAPQDRLLKRLYDADPDPKR
ncbi:MAG: tetratricopeptide repeat protein [Phycisphaerae bacterium]